MTFEERIDRLTERQEALAQSVELVARNNIDLQASMVELRTLSKHNSKMLDGLLHATDRLVKIAVAGRITRLEA